MKTPTLEKRKATRLYQLLSYIKESPNGRRANEIKKWLYERINPGKTFDPVENRGTYGTALYDNYDGIFKRWCKKVDGRWIMDKPMPDDLRAPLYHDPNAEFNFGPSAYHVIDLGNNVYTITEKDKAKRAEFRKTHYMSFPWKEKPSKSS